MRSEHWQKPITCCLAERASELGLDLSHYEDKQNISLMAITDAVIRSRYIQTGSHTWPSRSSLDRMCSRLNDVVGPQVGARND
jgi:hypothetical protein